MARSQRLSIAESVRQALARARQVEPLGDPKKKLAAIRVAARHKPPTSDIDTMLAEVERGYSIGQRP